MDRIYKLSLKMFSEMFQPEKMKATSSIINEVINNEFQPLLKEVKIKKVGEIKCQRLLKWKQLEIL